MLFRRLAVFAGGCTLEEAEKVAGATVEGMQSLLQKAMLRRSGERYSMLQVTREFALDQLRETPEVDDRMRLLAELLVADEDSRYREDVDNWRAVVDWAVPRADADAALTAVARARAFRPRPEEILFWGYRALEQRGAEASPRRARRAFDEVAVGHQFRGDHERPSQPASRRHGFSRTPATTKATRSRWSGSQARSATRAAIGGSARCSRRRCACSRSSARRARHGGCSTASGRWSSIEAISPRRAGHLERAVREAGTGRDATQRARRMASAIWRWLRATRRGLGRRTVPRSARAWSWTPHLVVHCLGGLAAADAREGKAADAAAGWAMAERYGELRGVTLAAHAPGSLSRLHLVRASGAARRGARPKWARADAAAVEEARAPLRRLTRDAPARRPARLDRAARARGRARPRRRRGRPAPRDHGDRRPHRARRRACAPLRESALEPPAADQPVRHRAAHVPRLRGRLARRRRGQARRRVRAAAAAGPRREGQGPAEAEVDRGLDAEERALRPVPGGRPHRRPDRPRPAPDPDLLAARRRAVHHPARGDHEGPAHGRPQRRHVPDAEARLALDRHALADPQGRAPGLPDDRRQDGGRGRARARPRHRLLRQRAAAEAHRRADAGRVPEGRARRARPGEDGRPGGARERGNRPGGDHRARRPRRARGPSATTPATTPRPRSSPSSA